MKITLQIEEEFEQRTEILKQRFEGADTYHWTYGDTAYRYQFYDLN